MTVPIKAIPSPPPRRRGPGGLHTGIDAHGSYAPISKPGRNEPCACGSGKKAKRCHPDGLAPVVNRVLQDEVCDACGEKKRMVVPLKHDKVPGVVLGKVCRECINDPATLKRLVDRGRSGAPVVPPDPLLAPKA